MASGRIVGGKLRPEIRDLSTLQGEHSTLHLKSSSMYSMTVTIKTVFFYRDQEVFDRYIAIIEDVEL